MKAKFMGLLAVVWAACAGQASAAVVSLDFTGVVDLNQGNSTTVAGFYNGGTSGHGTSGTNYGVNFSANALAINGYNGCCEPDSPTPGILFFLTSTAVTIDYAAGFTTGFSFNYSSNSANTVVSVYDGLGGTGNLLASVSLAQQANTGCAAGSSGFYCNWDPIGVLFNGTAKSISFGGDANFVAYDNITFGSDSPGAPVPLPAAAWLLLSGLGGLGFLRKRKAA